MSHIRVKTTYLEMGSYGGDIINTLYCHHNLSCDRVTFYEEDGSISGMAFHDWARGKDKWDAVQKLWSPFKDEKFKELKDGVEYYYVAPWESKE